MTPVKKGLSEYFKTIEIYISRKDYSVNRIEMNETSGDNTSISFTNKVINGAIADNLFAVN
jgi:outer membrane lipoprotein-sorting protein